MSFESMKYTKSKSLFDKAKQLIPGGVNSPVRAFTGVSGTPRFIDRGDGAYIWDVDGNRYLDYVLSWGPLILGHAHPAVVSALDQATKRGTSYGAPTEVELQLADLIIDTIPSIEMIRFVNSGTEATMSSLRLARAYTKRNKIIKFAGCYHGHADMLLVQAGSGVATLGLPESPGVPPASVADTLIAKYNDLGSVEELFAKFPEQIATVIVEPIAGNMGFVMPESGFLFSLQKICKDNGALLIFDEIMTGFRVDIGGAQKVFGLDPDLTCLGKVIGGGLPVGAYGGKREIMQLVAPSGAVYQAGTLSGNPLAMTAGLATLRTLLASSLFDEISQKARQLVEGIQEIADTLNVPLQASYAGSMFGFFFLKETGARIINYSTSKQHADATKYAKFFHALLANGFYFAPSQFEVGFVSSAHTSAHISATLTAVEFFLTNLTSPS